MDDITCNTVFSNGTLTVHIGGAIDHHTAREARAVTDKAIIDTGTKKLILDLSEVEFMDSAGLGLILGRYTKMNDAGGTLTVKNPSNEILRIIKMAGVEKLVSIELQKQNSN